MTVPPEVPETRVCRLLGVDPGQTTGLFAVDVVSAPVGGWYPDGHPIATSCDMTAAQLPPEEVAAFVTRWLQRNADSTTPVLIVIERYVITTRTARLSQQPAALEVTGVVKHLAREAGVRVVEQLKSNAARLASDNRLRQVGWHRPGRRHENDAARHALVALASADAVLFERLLTQDTINTSKNTS